MHREKAGCAAEVVGFVEQCSLSGSIDVGDYQKAIEDLSSMQFSFEDVHMFLFKPKLNVLLNLVGLHYCIFCLEMPVNPPCTLCSVKIRKSEGCMWQMIAFFNALIRNHIWASLPCKITFKQSLVIA